MIEDDLVADILARAQRALGFDDDVRNRVELEVRQVWGGERLYIPHESQAVRQHRNQQIIASWQRGELPANIAERMGLSSRHVRRLIKQTRRKRVSKL